MSRSDAGVDVERTNLEGGWWTARVRYRHRFPDDAVAEEVDAHDVAQGASATVRDGRVETVHVPDAELRTAADVEKIAREVTHELEDA